MLWLDLVSADPSVETLAPQLEALGRLASELDVRFAGAGLGGIEGAVALHERLRAVLDALTAEDLARMQSHVAAVERALTEIRGRLDALRDLKALVEGAEPAGSRGRDGS